MSPPAKLRLTQLANLPGIQKRAVAQKVDAPDTMEYFLHQCLGTKTNKLQQTSAEFHPKSYHFMLVSVQKLSHKYSFDYSRD